MTTSKTSIIQAIYGAFGRGDVPAIVEAFAPDGEIRFNVAAPSAPWQRTVHGQAALPTFFGAIAANVEFSAFEPLEFVEGPSEVIVRIRMSYRVKATGRAVDQTQVHWWNFDGSRVRTLVHYEDTAQVGAAVAA